MKERPILMSAPMVRAILAGHKTQTRRPVKPMKHPYGDRLSVDDVVSEMKWKTGAISSPLGRKGNRLWVRETHAILDSHGQYRPDGPRWGPWGGLPMTVSPDGKQVAYYRAAFDRCGPPKWRPSIHMPRWASRIALEITDVRVERLREITAEDAIAEGFAGNDPIAGFADTWNEVYGEFSWAHNPWVWVIDFRRERDK